MFRLQLLTTLPGRPSWLSPSVTSAAASSFMASAARHVATSSTNIAVPAFPLSVLTWPPPANREAYDPFPSPWDLPENA